MKDDTLRLIGQHLKNIEVLYLKGLKNVTDDGVCAIAEQCSKLRVLELSNVPMTDVAGLAIGQNLKNLEALYMRDNYLLTNDTVQSITEGCKKLLQLTLWGCIRLKTTTSGLGLRNLVLLNFWGCHYLQDEFAKSLSDLASLRSLIVAECHKLGDKFVENLCCAIPHIQHLNLRYLKNITNRSLESMAQGLKNLYSLDVSFCTKFSDEAIGFLLLSLPGLSELHMFSCHQLTSEGIERWWKDGICLSGDCCLSIVDLRQCVEPKTLPFLTAKFRGFRSFNEFVPNYFTRDARWGSDASGPHGLKNFLNGHHKVRTIVRHDTRTFGSGILKANSSASISTYPRGAYSHEDSDAAAADELNDMVGLEI